jgi:integrase/recombinase XerD
MEQLYQQFLREKQYLSNVSPRTIKYLRWVFNRWDDLIDAFPDKQNVKEWVIKLTESGISPSTINSYIRGFNSFLT